MDVEYSFDGSKLLFFFTSEGRVDFRALVKDLAAIFHTRIELRQIGVRDEAKMLGGLGICGKPFCCASFLEEFQPVSIKMAKTQNLSLNPTKISGTCGRLMCCLKYEQEAYEDAVKRCPKMESFVETPDGVGTVTAVNLLREQVKVRLDDTTDLPKTYHNCEISVGGAERQRQTSGGLRPALSRGAGQAPPRCAPKQQMKAAEQRDDLLLFWEGGQPGGERTRAAEAEEAPLRRARKKNRTGGAAGKPRQEHRADFPAGENAPPVHSQPPASKPAPQQEAGEEKKPAFRRRRWRGKRKSGGENK